MARRNNLAGLAALGALGYALTRGGSKAPVEDRVGEDVVRPAAEPEVDYGPDYEREVSRGSRGPVGVGASSGQNAKKPYSMASDTVDANIKRMTDTGDETDRLAKRYPKPAAKAVSKALSYEERLGKIPGSSPEGWTGGTGERVTGNEITRNLDAMMLGRGPTGITQMGRLGAEALGAKGVQRAYNARAAARRANEGLTAEEAAAAVQAAREAKTMNPNAWMAGPKGMMENFKKGGAVKAKAKKLVVTKSGGKVSSASKRADGIASKGKTRGKLY